MICMLTHLACNNNNNTVDTCSHTKPATITTTTQHLLVHQAWPTIPTTLIQYNYHALCINSNNHNSSQHRHNAFIAHYTLITTITIKTYLFIQACLMLSNHNTQHNTHVMASCILNLISTSISYILYTSILIYHATTINTLFNINNYWILYTIIHFSHNVHRMFN